MSTSCPDSCPGAAAPAPPGAAAPAPGGRAFLFASAAVALFSLVVRLHDAWAFPPLRDPDAAGHALNVAALFEGRLPDPRSWSGGHPPLFHAIGAALWRVLPEAVPVHVALRLVSVAAWLGAVAIVWRVLRRRVGDVDAAVTCALLLGVPGVVIATSAMSNDPLCALLVTATLARLVDAGAGGPPSARHAALTGLLAGLAALAKASGLAVVGLAGAGTLFASRRSPRAALRNVLAFGLVAAAVAGPHYARLLAELPGSPFEVAIGYAGSEERRAVSEALALPPETFRPRVPVWMHAALWGDPFQEFLPETRAGRWLFLAGLLVSGVALAGGLRAARRRELARGLWAPLLYAGILAVSFLRMVLRYPHPMLLKAGYVLSGALPGALLVAWGVGAGGPRTRRVLRGALLAVAAAGSAATWYGWWEPSAAAPGEARARAAPGSAEDAALLYFRLLARDPIRRLALEAPELHEARGIRLSWVFDEDFEPARDLPADARRSRELARARVAELELYKLAPWYGPTAEALRAQVTAADVSGDRAAVAVRVRAAAGAAPTGAPGTWPFPPFEQQMALRRDRAGAWRIASIRQSGVSDANAGAAFVAHPTRAGLERVRAALPRAGRSPEPGPQRP